MPFLANIYTLWLAPGFTEFTQRLANGNTLICSGTQGRVFEVTPSGDIVWEYVNPFGGGEQSALFRATRIALDHPGLRALAR